MPGEALWPARYDVEALGRIKEVQTKKDGAYSWEALYQQNPTPRQGSFFKVLQLQIVKSLPAKLRAVRGWDLAATPDDGDWTAGVRIAGPCENGIYYVTNVKRAQLESDDRDKLMKQTAHTDGYNTKIRLAQDPGQAGKDQAKRLVKMLAGFSVRSETVSGSKETRADGFASQVNAGNVRLLEGEWNADYIEELRTFPKGKNDDQVDGSADAFNELQVRQNGEDIRQKLRHKALNGGTIEVPTLRGTKKIKVAPGTRHGTIQRLRGEGPPKPKGRKGNGDIRYRLEIAVPTDLSEEQREAAEKLAEALNGSDPRADLLREAGVA